MRFARFSMFRIGLVSVLAVCVAAVLLGREYRRPAEPRRLTRVSCTILEGSRPSTRTTIRLLDLRNGGVRSLALPEDDSLSHAALAPWTDEQGRSQIVGLWVRRTGSGTRRVIEEFGLARYRFPDGAMLNRVSTEFLPYGRPCWLPGTEARVLYASHDGALYQVAFENSQSPRASPDNGDPQPVRMHWAIPGLDPHTVHVSDVCASADSRLNGRLIATVRHRDPQYKRISQPQLWWLKTDAAVSTIIDGGPLLRTVSADDWSREHRLPSLGLDASGRLCLTYLERWPTRMVEWTLRVQPVQFDEDGKSLHVERDAGRVLSERCVLSPPVLSPDGRYVGCMVRLDSGREVAQRLPLPGQPFDEDESRFLAALMADWNAGPETQ